MKKIINTYNLLLVIIFLLSSIMGCAKVSKPNAEISDKSTTSETKIDKLDVLDLASDKSIIPLESPKAGEITGKVSLSGQEIESDSTYTHITEIPDEIDSLNSQAYRVQLFSSKVFGESRKAKQVAEEIFDRPVFMDYEVPYYKIRVGNFADREKAEEYSLRAKSAGYTSAWIVVVIVNPNETSPLYEDLPIQQYADSLLKDNEEIREDDSTTSEE